MNCLVCEDPAVKLIVEEDERIYIPVAQQHFVIDLRDKKGEIRTTEQKA